MQVEVRLKIKSNPNLYRYLRENSYWYKYLNRSPLFLRRLEEEMKEKYRLRSVDKIENISNSLNLIKSFLEVMR
ncbi:MAG TPA: YlbE-like family protein [Candidatus Onthousia faecipullorum]|uniref:YlbE-like family protein n=1 Tax=Candidatus Onthousia faecipullorum TaxID=2840887 RepID=A0A9D1GBQ9_9FIRM|nr:YlbE-like family protein [Candidatus Onthousia faecipullorum]